MRVGQKDRFDAWQGRNGHRHAEEGGVETGPVRQVACGNRARFQHHFIHARTLTAAGDNEGNGPRSVGVGDLGPAENVAGGVTVRCHGELHIVGGVGGSVDGDALQVIGGGVLAVDLQPG